MNLKIYLVKNGLNQADFAKKCGISPTTLSQYFCGKPTVKVATLMKISQATENQVSIDDLRNPDRF